MSVNIKSKLNNLFDIFDRNSEKIIIFLKLIFKSLLSRPAGYRELEIDADGNVIQIMKIDSERFTSNK